MRAHVLFLYGKFTTNREKKYSLWYTVEPRYLELGYLELPAISNLNPFPLDFPLLFQSFILSYLELGYLANSRLSRTYTHFPWICPCFFSHSYSVISNSPLSRTPGCLELKPISLEFALAFSVIHTRLSRTPRYLELPAVSNLNPFPLNLPLLFQSFILGYLELGYRELPAISNYFLFPFGPKSTPVISNSNDEVD